MSELKQPLPINIMNISDSSKRVFLFGPDVNLKRFIFLPSGKAWFDDIIYFSPIEGVSYSEILRRIVVQPTTLDLVQVHAIGNIKKISKRLKNTIMQYRDVNGNRASKEFALHYDPYYLQPNNFFSDARMNRVRLDLYTSFTFKLPACAILEMKFFID